MHGSVTLCPSRRMVFTGLLGLVGLVLAMAVGASAARADAATRLVIDFDGVLEQDLCTGEQFLLSGQFVVVTRQGTDASGGFHQISTHVAQGIDGVGLTTGTRYHLIAAGANVTNITSGGALVLEMRSQSLRTTSGLLMRVTFHIQLTIAANGETVVSLDRPTFECFV
jgi:hypothetical protein